jgi:hypothetical protein
MRLRDGRAARRGRRAARPAPTPTRACQLTNSPLSVSLAGQHRSSRPSVALRTHGTSSRDDSRSGLTGALCRLHCSIASTLPPGYDNLRTPLAAATPPCQLQKRCLGLGRHSVLTRRPLHASAMYGLDGPPALPVGQPHALRAPAQMQPSASSSALFTSPPHGHLHTGSLISPTSPPHTHRGMQLISPLAPPLLPGEQMPRSPSSPSHGQFFTHDSDRSALSASSSSSSLPPRYNSSHYSAAAPGNEFSMLHPSLQTTAGAMVRDDICASFERCVGCA